MKSLDFERQKQGRNREIERDFINKKKEKKRKKKITQNLHTHPPKMEKKRGPLNDKIGPPHTNFRAHYSDLGGRHIPKDLNF